MGFSEDLETDALQRLSVAAAVEGLDERSVISSPCATAPICPRGRSGRSWALKTNAVEVALHRTLARLRPELEEPRPAGTEPARQFSGLRRRSSRNEASGWA